MTESPTPSAPHTKSPNRYVISLGSNLGNREDYLQHAVNQLLAVPNTKLSATTALYETAPWVGEEGDRNQPWYLNAAIEIQSPLAPLELLDVCQQAELSAGRPPADQRHINAARSLDVDILWCNAHPQLNTPKLTLPHPRFHQRACTLVPLLEHWAEWVHPKTQQTLTQHHLTLNNPEPVRLFALAPW